jgi:hypothetical protein
MTLGDERPSREDQPLRQALRRVGLVNRSRVVVAHRRGDPKELEGAVALEVLEQPAQASVLGIYGVVALDGLPVQQAGSGGELLVLRQEPLDCGAVEGLLEAVALHEVEQVRAGLPVFGGLVVLDGLGDVAEAPIGPASRPPSPRHRRSTSSSAWWRALRVLNPPADAVIPSGHIPSAQRATHRMQAARRAVGLGWARRRRDHGLSRAGAPRR